MGTEWKRLTMQSGAWVATVTAIVIGAGALLWHERDATLYPTTRDEAEVRFALLERMVAAGVQTATASNTVGFYPSWNFFMVDLPYTLYISMENRFLDLWPDGATALAGRSPAEYPLAFGGGELIGNNWWATNMYADRAYFGDFQYLYTNTFYTTTNILNQTGRALSAMRWTMQRYNTWGTIVPEDNELLWEVTSDATNDYDAAYQQALDKLGAATTGDDWALTNYHVVTHYVEMLMYNSSGIRCRLKERAVFSTDALWIPPATNVAAWQVGAYDSNALLFWHPTAESNQWTTAECQMEEIGPGTNAFREVLFRWQGRIDTTEARSLSFDRAYSYTVLIVGWQGFSPNLIGEYPGQAVFLADWQFQCLTNRAAFWD
jgi:hypothetical protein